MLKVPSFHSLKESRLPKNHDCLFQGEFLGVVLVLFTARKIPNSHSFCPLDVILLFIGWVFYAYRPAVGQNWTEFTWNLFPLMGLISLGWSAGDVSLAAHTQANLGKHVRQQTLHTITCCVFVPLHL